MHERIIIYSNVSLSEQFSKTVLIDSFQLLTFKQSWIIVVQKYFWTMWVKKLNTKNDMYVQIGEIGEQ